MTQEKIRIVTASDIGAVNDTWKNQGSVLDVRDTNSISIYISYTANNSTGAQLLVYRGTATLDCAFTMDTTSLYQKTIGDSNVEIVYDYDTKESQYLQFQTKATVIGATEGTITITVIKNRGL